MARTWRKAEAQAISSTDLHISLPLQDFAMEPSGSYTLTRTISLN